MRPNASARTDAPTSSFKILVIASLRYPIAQPFAGGLEAHTWSLATGLRARGHSVLVAGATGSDPSVVGYEFGRLPTGDGSERADITNHPDVSRAERQGFTDLITQVRDGLLGSFDLIHNNALHPYPVEQAHTLDVPMVTTLHTPVLPWAQRVLGESAVPQHSQHFVAVSRATADAWRPLIRPQVVRNGVDTDLWRPGPGGPGAVWSGRIAAEKAPHLAIDLARAAGIELTIAGPIVDEPYYAAAIAPRLGPGVRYAGHLDQQRLAELVGHSALALVTPVWNEPFGLVAVEAMACGTPVVALARGGLPEIVDRRSGRLIPPTEATGFAPDDLAAAVRAMAQAATLDRGAVRQRALARGSAAAMIHGYEQVYQRAVRRWTRS